MCREKHCKYGREALCTCDLIRKDDSFRMQNMTISKNNVSNILYRRWIACYMLYDWNPHHAAQAFDNNEIARYQHVAELLGDTFLASSIIHKDLTELYNEVLAKDVEDFVQQHINVCQCSRYHVELGIAKAMAEVF